MPLSVTAAVLPAVLGAGKAVIGGMDVRKAKDEMEALSDPFFKIQNEYTQNRNASAQQASFGLSSAAKNEFQKGAEQGLASAMSATNQAGGGVNDIARIFQNYMSSIGQTAAQDTLVQTQKIQEFMNRNKELAGRKEMQWAVNEYQPYQNKVRQLQQRIATGKENMYGGISDATGALATIPTFFQNRDWIEALKGLNPSGVSTGSTNTANPGVDMNSITGGMTGNRATLREGAPQYGYQSAQASGLSPEEIEQILGI